MKLSKELIEMGIDKPLIILLHSKTRLKDRTIQSAKLIKSIDNKFLVQLELDSAGGYRIRKSVLNIDKNRIREIKLNMIFS